MGEHPKPCSEVDHTTHMRRRTEKFDTAPYQASFKEHWGRETSYVKKDFSPERSTRRDAYRRRLESRPFADIIGARKKVEEEARGRCGDGTKS